MFVFFPKSKDAITSVAELRFLFRCRPVGDSDLFIVETNSLENICILIYGSSLPGGYNGFGEEEGQHYDMT